MHLTHMGLLRAVFYLSSLRRWLELTDLEEEDAASSWTNQILSPNNVDFWCETEEEGSKSAAV